jgi:tRNA/tmRNA/rRNA uracil-C5-methylase (TrmA/RlmC/RlmD family)
VSGRQNRERAAGGESLVGREWTVEVGPVAHGGHCVARHEGQVVFVRHTLPGERVVARVTEGRVGDSFVRADAVDVLEAAPGRVEAPCPYAVPGGCGGCDFQHASLDTQRALKSAVVREQFARVAGLDVDVDVQPVPGDEAGLRWRTRVEFAVDGAGRAGLRGHRSRDVVPVDDCLIATRGVIDSGVLDTEWPDLESVDVVDAVHPEEPVLVPLPAPEGGGGGGLVGELARDGDWEGEYVVAARGFWQVHPGAASTFLTRVTTLLGAEPGDRVLDLYAGSGLFTMRLGELVAPDGVVLGVEGDRRAVENGSANTEHLDNVEWRANRVDRELRSLVGQDVTADLVVLDPPRTGAGKDVMGLLAQLGPRRVVYVACDPSALARDVKAAGTHGYDLVSLEAWDAFPMTHHVECIAVLEPRGESTRPQA